MINIYIILYCSLFVCRAEDDGRYMNDHGGARFQRSQSQNDLDRQPYDDRLFDPKDLRTSASGFNIQRTDLNREGDQGLRRHPSDVGDRYRRSYGEWDGAQMPPTAVGSGNISWTDALVLRQKQADQKLRTPSDPSRDIEGPQRDDLRDREYQTDRDGRRLQSAGEEYHRSHENIADVSALNKKPSVRNENPKNQDIINWLQLGDTGDRQPHVTASNVDGRDINSSVSNYGRSTADRPEDHPTSRTGYGTEPSVSSPRYYPATRSDGDVTSGRVGLQNSAISGPRANREDTGFQQFGVTNPAYDAGHRASVSDQTPSSDGSVRGREAVSQQHGYIRGLHAFPDSSHRPNSDHRHDQSSHDQVRSMGYASPEDRYDASSRVPPAKPVHTVFSNSPSTHGWDQSTDLAPVLPPKLANQQASMKPPNDSLGQSDPYQRPDEAPSRSVVVDHQLQVMKDDASVPSEYAVVYKRPVQSMVYDMSVVDPVYRDDVDKMERPGADGAGYPFDIASRVRQSPDGTLNSPEPPSARSNPTIQPPTIYVSSSSDFGNEQRPGLKSSSQENLASSPPVRPPLPSDDALTVSGVLVPTRAEPQGGAENTDIQVTMFFLDCCQWKCALGVFFFSHRTEIFDR